MPKRRNQIKHLDLYKYMNIKNCNDDYTIILTASKKIEDLLRKLKGTGEGLGTLADSIRSELNYNIFQKIKQINRTRNKIVHDIDCESVKSGCGYFKDIDEFYKTYIEVLNYLLDELYRSERIRMQSIYKLYKPKRSLSPQKKRLRLMFSKKKKKSNVQRLVRYHIF